jgi:MFS family permease
MKSRVLGLRVFLFFAGGFFLSYLYRSVNAVLAPDLIADLGLRADQLGLLTSVYLLAFASFQPVLGVLLDRFGPRRVEATLLLLAAGGALVFAAADGMTGLLVGRALIGVGVSACLMGGLKANVLWFDGPRLPLVNGLLLAAGGLGAVCAGLPIEVGLHWTDWRGILVALAAVTLLLAIGIAAGVPERTAPDGVPNRHELLAGLRRVYASRLFWRVAPATMLSQGAFLATQGLWAGPWLADVSGLERRAVATHLSAIAAAMAVGFLLTGVVTERLERSGVPARQVAGGGMILFVVIQILILAFPAGPTLLLWCAYGLCGTAGIITFTTLTRGFGAGLTGRANTAVTLVTFASAFAIQTATGALLEYFPGDATGHYEPAGHRLALAAVIGAQIVALVWYCIPVRANR